MVDSLARPWIGLTLVAESPSTNADLVQAARTGAAPLWSVLVAEHQSAGRGRLGRTWTTAPGVALTFSALVPATADPGWIPLLTGLALAEAIEERYAVRPVLKWPNDVLAPAGNAEPPAASGGGKLAGILCEMTALPGGNGAPERRAVVIGIGLNVDQLDGELPVPTATSLRQMCGGHPDGLTREGLLLTVLDRLASRIGDWVRDPAAVREAYRSSCSTIGQQVRVDLGAGDLSTGSALRIDDDGRLVVDLGRGPQALAAGDVTHVRPA